MSPAPLFSAAAEIIFQGLVNLLMHQHPTSLLFSFDPQVGILQLHHKFFSMGQPLDPLLLNLVQSLLQLLVG